jgi:hypothetical protein
LHAHPAARAPNCGKTCTLHLRREHPCGCGVSVRGRGSGNCHPLTFCGRGDGFGSCA